MRFLLSTLLATSLGFGSLGAQDTDGPQNARQQSSEMLQKGDLDNALKEIEAMRQIARQRIRDSIQRGDLDIALGLSESSGLGAVEVRGFRRQIAIAMMRGGNVDGAMEIFADNAKQVIENAQQANELRGVQSDIMLALSVGQRSGKVDQIMGLLDAAMEKLQTIDGDEKQKAEEEFALAALMTRGLVATGNADEAKGIAESYIAKAREIVAASPDQTASLVDALMNVVNYAVDGNNVELFAMVRSLVTASVDAEPTNASAVTRYGSTMNRILRHMLQSDPEAAEAMLADVRATFAKIKEANVESSPLINNLLGNYERSFSSYELQLESDKVLAKLVGSPAPELDAKYWVNGQSREPADLKGKVVLLDFWAVWCAPCIITFPHLREWNEEFGEKGLQIVGVTRKYNYEWNDETERASRTEEPQSDEAELAMLEKFLAHHELKHPTIVTPDDSKMQASYAVTGIPHAVVIDKKGIVRLIKTGSGEANAKAIHDMIVECLAEEG